MPWPLFLLVISACLIQNIQTAPKAIAYGNKKDLGSGSAPQTGCPNCKITPCRQCQGLTHAAGPWGLNDSVELLKLTCRVERDYQYFCSQIRGKEMEFVDTVYRHLKSDKDDWIPVETCAIYSVCDPSS
ncbi:hypothetical protein DdX_16805 [Ditylenchus destructor]|uniref:Uncharacterized protein n=1 Tax=Ditylenchus destructor TaxID=166010 RepID=A0AAD4MNE1_9BILA|nr:hypothetical protein DdX_16805 [Ditylenchus destructor]